MKKYKSYIILLFVILLTSCEEVVDIELTESEPRLVIEASITWLKGTDGIDQKMRLTETSPFYEESLSAVEDANVLIISENGETFEFIHQNNGYYRNNQFKPSLNIKYYLQVNYNNEIYTASETLKPVSKIDFIEQTQTGGFSGEDIEVKAYYTDPENEKNFYLFKFFEDGITTLELYEDEFTNGNQIFGYYSEDNLEPGDEIDIQIQGISKSYFEYLFILRSQVGTNQGGPFETMPATVKGNIINTTNPDNYPFGFFRLSEVDSTSYTIE
ncbi:DUF4249 family protein [Christiangramia salexigens]|uniref:DUF4249 domain-containing protein n=1 Tax=Christiangramia salexigens TaxID=1913577 RepID=A0A1L3J1F3_9FLAO|nr:DUF4249 family protein [Christiangramia salexigens]APG58954.1 hypothetical protein LPB144_00405 [Christiangramia salexigens]